MCWIPEGGDALKIVDVAAGSAGRDGALRMADLTLADRIAASAK